MSISLELIQMLMQELGPNTPEVDAILQTDDTTWAVQFDDDRAILIEWADDPRRLVLSAILGRASSATQIAVYETLLSYNLLWKETGGVRMALDGPEGDVMLIYDLYEDQLTESELRTVMVNFADLAALWTEYVTSEVTTSALPPISQDTMHLRA